MSLKVAQKMYLLAGVTVGAFAVLTIGTSVAISSVERATHKLTDEEIPQLNTLRETEQLLLNARRFEKDVLINAGNAEAQKGYREQFKATEEKTKANASKIAEFTEKDEDFTTELKNETKQLPSGVNQYFADTAKILDAFMADAQAQIQKTNTDLKPAKESANLAEKILSKLVEQSAKSRSEVMDSLESSVSRAMKIALTIGLIAAAGVLFGAFAIARSIIKPLQFITEGAKRFAIGDIELHGMDTDYIKMVTERDDELGEISKSFHGLIAYQKEKVAVASNVAQGNLNIEPKAASDQDALGRALIQMHGNLNNLVLQLRTTADQVAQGSSQVSSASQALARGATTQASTLEEISAAVTEMTSQAKKNADNAVQASQSAASAQTAAEEGKEKIQTTVAAMNAISEASQQISKVIKLIDDIAFQTNLLALNAAVEAARAGKHGKGFAVVADEVRNLASRSAKAARETSELIETSLAKVENGVKQAQSTAESFASINEGVTQMSVALSAIVDSSNAQAGSAHEIAQGLSNVNNVTQQNTASAEENAAASEEMSGMAAQLKNIVARFSVRDGQTATSVATKPTLEQKTTHKPAAAAPAHKPAPVANKPATTVAKPKAPATPPPAPAAKKPASAPAQATKKHSDHPEYSSTGDTNAAKGWGGTDKSHIPAVKPEEVLALDDEEFGKY